MPITDIGSTGKINDAIDIYDIPAANRTTDLPPAAVLDAMSAEIAALTKQAGGATYSPLFGNQKESARTSYAVSLRRRGVRRIPASSPILELEIKWFFEDFWYLLADSRCCVGVWKDGRWIELNITFAVANLSHAFRLARLCRQRWIYVLGPLPSNANRLIRVPHCNSRRKRGISAAVVLKKLYRIETDSPRVLLTIKPHKRTPSNGRPFPPDDNAGYAGSFAQLPTLPISRSGGGALPMPRIRPTRTSGSEVPPIYVNRGSHYRPCACAQS